MPKVLIEADVENFAKWEEGFHSHGKLFRSQTINKPICYAETAANKVACVFEPENLDTYMQILDSPATAEAMEFDGVKRETVKVFVLDKEFDPS